MDNLNSDIYLGHKKYIKLVVLKEMEPYLDQILSMIIFNLNINEKPELTIADGPDQASKTIEWMFSDIVSRKWINIEPTISSRLRKLRRQKKLIAFNITWV